MNSQTPPWDSNYHPQVVPMDDENQCQQQYQYQYHSQPDCTSTSMNTSMNTGVHSSMNSSSNRDVQRHVYHEPHHPSSISTSRGTGKNKRSFHEHNEDTLMGDESSSDMGGGDDIQHIRQLKRCRMDMNMDDANMNVNMNVPSRSYQPNTSQSWKTLPLHQTVESHQHQHQHHLGRKRPLEQPESQFARTVSYGGKFHDRVKMHRIDDPSNTIDERSTVSMDEEVHRSLSASDHKYNHISNNNNVPEYGSMNKMLRMLHMARRAKHHGHEHANDHVNDHGYNKHTPATECQAIGTKSGAQRQQEINNNGHNGWPDASTSTSSTSTSAPSVQSSLSTLHEAAHQRYLHQQHQNNVRSQPTQPKVPSWKRQVKLQTDSNLF